jgi:hypothetical protein
VLARGDGAAHGVAARRRRLRVEVDLDVVGGERRVQVSRPAVQPVLLGDAAQSLAVAAHQDRVGPDLVATGAADASRLADRDDGPHEMLVVAHPAGDTVHRDTE